MADLFGFAYLLKIYLDDRHDFSKAHLNASHCNTNIKSFTNISLLSKDGVTQVKKYLISFIARKRTIK